MLIDWKLVDKITAGAVVVLNFQRVQWMRDTVHAGDAEWVECDFDHPDAVAHEVSGRMCILESPDTAVEFESGKTYRSTFG